MLYEVITQFLLAQLTLAAVPIDASRYKFMQLSIDDGLSNNQVKAVLKDSRGFMWFGTGRGLNRFDGTTRVITSYSIHYTKLYDSEWGG